MQFSTQSVRFLGQLVDSAGILPDPQKVEAVQLMKSPTSPSEVRRFLGMANQLGKFTPSLAEVTKPLRDLLSSKNSWVWDTPQEQAFTAVTKLQSSSPVLALYSPDRDTIAFADASAFGLGGVLLQKQPSGTWQPVAYVSRALTPTEQKYAQIEKEALAITWSCE